MVLKRYAEAKRNTTGSAGQQQRRKTWRRNGDTQNAGQTERVEA